MVIVLEEILEDSLEMSFADDDNMIQAVPADGSDQPFSVRIGLKDKLLLIGRLRGHGSLPSRIRSILGLDASWN